MRSRLSLVAMTLVLACTLAGCAGSSWQFWKSSTEAPAEPVAATASPVATAPATAMPAASVSGASSRDFTPLPELSDVRFRPGLVTIGQADAPALDAVVRWLREHPTALVQIEGHSDDLGTPSGNRAVAEKRALAVMKYLVAKGVEPQRVSIVSYGSERPLCMEKTDACRAKNRRAQFRITQP
jgi:peptidoglycan-associated lipoprotein